MKKMKKQGGFTLVEMLIVVAIIAILIAVSIPLVSSSLERAREATDAANERSFKAALTVAYLTSENLDDDATAGGTKVDAGTVYAYDAVNGKPTITNMSKINPYGQGKAGEGKDDDSTTGKKQGKILYGQITKDGNVYMQWAEPADTAPTINESKGLTSDLLGKTTA